MKDGGDPPVAVAYGVLFGFRCVQKVKSTKVRISFLVHHRKGAQQKTIIHQHTVILNSLTFMYQHQMLVCLQAKI